MPTPSLSKQEWKRRKASIEEALKKGYPPPGTHGQHGAGAIRIAAKALKISPTSLQSSIARAETLGLPAPKWSIYKHPEADKIEAKTPDIVRTRNQIADLRKQLDDALKYSAKIEDVRTSVFGLANEQYKIPAWTTKTPTGIGRPEIPVLMTSDFQVGEVIRMDETECNEYSPEIFQERYRRLIRSTIRICELQDPKMRAPGIIYNRLGDAISGDIHADLAETQTLSSIQQVMLCAEEEMRGLQVLLDAFPSVTVHSVPGNHDRSTFGKPRSKRFVDYSYDTLLVYTLQKHFKNEPRITFNAPKSGDAFYSVTGTNFLATHGDRIGSRGGTGMVGPAATIARGVMRVRISQARLGKRVDYVIHGHLHTAMHLPNCISNSTLAGYSEYAKSEMRAEPEPPTQWLFFVHPKWGVTTMRKVRVDHD